MNNGVSTKFFLCATLFLLILVSFVNFSIAQQGTYLISGHSPAGNNNIYFDLEISSEGNTFIASKNGIIKYNGDQYSIIDRGGAVLALSSSPNNTIYAGGVGGFGFLTQDNSDGMYESLLSDSSIVVTDVLYTNGVLYAISNSALFKFNPETKNIEIFKDDLAGQFYHIFEFNDHLLLSTENKGILEIKINQLVTTDQSALLNKEITFVQKSPYSSKYIIGTYNHELFIYEDGNLQPLLVDNDFLLNTITCANWYDDDRVILGSTYGGIAIASVSDQKIAEEINFDSGLIANDVKSIEVDKNGNLLSLSDNLLELVALNVPIKSFTHFEGLVGTPQATAYFNNKLYVCTNRDLFTLNKVNNYEQRSYVIQKRIGSSSRSTLVETKTKKRLFGNRKQKEQIEPEVVEPRSVINKVITENIVTSSYFRFEKVEGTHHGNQLISSDTTLIVSGFSGVTELTTSGTNQITDTPSYYTYLSKDKQSIFVCSDNSVSTFHKRNDKWIENYILTDFNDDISHIIEYQGHFWLSGTNKIHKLTINKGELNDVEIYPIHNPYFDAIYGAINQDALHFYSSNNHYYFKDNFLVREEKYSPHQLTIDNNNNLWTNTNGVWQTPDAKHYNPLFSTISNIKHISADNENPYFWVLSENKDILRFDTKQDLEYSKYLPYLDAVNGSEPIHIAANQFSIEELNNRILFKVAHPDLTKLQNTLYRYRLRGLNNEWSDWSKNNEAKYSYLPSGDYVMEIESKSAFNQLYQLAPIEFTVVPPYWKQPMFYLFEFMVIVFLLMVSMKMRSLGSRFQILSRILAFLVLAIILEGIEAIMESNFDLKSSPFFSFALQVMTALILFPFEGFLRKYILLEKSSLLKKVLKK